jgi:hypothetical protein
VYKNQFKYDKAEDMFLHALDMSERLLGKAHPHVLNRCVLPHDHGRPTQRISFDEADR